MTLLQKLKEQGWHLTEEGLKKLTTDLQTDDVKKVVKAALDWDIRDIAGGALPIKPDSNGHISGRIVLQLQRMHNISAPKANEESTAAPRFLQIELSDGVNSIVALELERIPSLNLNVPPGTKLYFKGDKLQLIQGLLVLKASEVQVLGGNVEHLVEKWEVARQVQKYARSNRRISGAGGPPPWIAFGKPLDAHKDALPQDRNFKSLQAATEKDKNSKENDEFSASRVVAIAEAAKAGKKRVFGGGQQNILDHNVKKILEKGYSEEEAKYALKTTNNNLERALYYLKRKNNRGTTEALTKSSTAPASGGNQRVRGGVASAKEEAVASKPQTNVSLFDFLTEKLPATVYSSTSTQSQSTVTSNNNTQNARNSKESSKTYNSNSKSAAFAAGKFENTMSSSFAANRDRASTTRPEEKQTQSHSQRSNYNQRDERKSNPPNKQGGRGGERTRNTVQNNDKAAPQATSNNSSDVTTPSSGSNNTNNNNATQSTTYNANANRKNDRNERPPRKEREQTPRQSTGGTGSGGGGYQGNKRNQDYKSNDNNKSYQQRESNSRSTNENRNGNSSSYQQSTQQKSNSYDNTMDKLAESTSKMSIQNKKESYNNSQSRGRHQTASSRSSNTSQQNQQNASQSKSNSNQQQSGQFIGSQNLTNKTQGPSQQVVTTPSPQQQPQTFVTQLSNGYSYDPSKIMGFQSKEANEYAMNLLKSQGLLPQASPAPQQTQVPPPTQQHTQPQIINSPQAAPPPPVAYMAQTTNVFVATPPQQAPITQYGLSNNWHWNIGDLCLAKYWEDGNYYNAKITAVSESTCVVLFLGYGNYEEVVRTDCMPITDAQHHPINAYQAGPPPMQQLPQACQGANGGGGGGSQRYRSERPMYVPPNKRGNKNN